MLLDICDRGTEFKLWLLFDLQLLVERNDGSLLADLTEDRRSGTTTTGMAPFLQISRRALVLATELIVPVEARLSCRTA